MATSFGWKRKRNKLPKRSGSNAAFAEEAQVEPGTVTEDVDWLHNMPIKKQRLHLEDTYSKAKRLNGEGITLAENGRYWEAIHKWDESLTLVENDEKVLDMKAQALMNLNKPFPAVTAAKQAVACNPKWWISLQTLGRALLNIGEINAAITSFQRAVHINPDCKELWEEDLCWAIKLLKDLYKKNSNDISKDELCFLVRECMRIGITEHKLSS